MAPDTQEGRVTLAILGTKLDNIEEKIDKLNGTVSANHDVCVGYQGWKPEHEKRHDRENVVLKAWSVVSASVTGAGAALLAWFK